MIRKRRMIRMICMITFVCLHDLHDLHDILIKKTYFQVQIMRIMQIMQKNIYSSKKKNWVALAQKNA